MATLPSSSSSSTKPLIIKSTSLFLSSSKSHSNLSPETLIVNTSPLPAIPSDLPQTKLIPGTRFIVDGFKFAGDFSVSYFLSHFHSDHYAGLNPNWSKGIIFCSEVTAALLVKTLNVSPLFVVPLELNATIEIDGCEVTAVDANHCPGAVQFLVKVPRLEDGKFERYIHTGDFRFRDLMKKDPILCQFVGADAIFLDTTYCNPKFVFPSQEESIDYVVNTIERIRTQNEGSKDSTLFLIATYVVGKERILLDISRRCGCLLHVDSKKMEILSILGFGDSGVFTKDASASNVHVIGWNLLGETWPYFRPNYVKMKEIMVERGYSKAVGFVSTGWMYETKGEGFAVRVKDELEIHLVPYSEHSSYEELREYVRFLRPKRVIPTVGMDVEKSDGKGALSLQRHFRGLVDETANKQEFLMAFSKKLGNDAAITGDDTIVTANQPEDGEGKYNSGPEFSLEALNDEEIESTTKELGDCLPSWVTKDQIFSLLRGSKGDVVEAVTEFFEHETEFYEKAKASMDPTPSSQMNLPSDITFFHEVKSSQDCDSKSFDIGKKSVVSCSQHRGSKLLDIGKKSVIPSIATPKSSAPKRRGSNIGSKMKKKGKTSSTSKSGGLKQSSITRFTTKKGKTSSTLESNGPKQSTITKFFGKIVSSTHQDQQHDTVNEAMEKNVDNSVVVDAVNEAMEKNVDNSAVEMYKEELDQFLHIIDDGIARNTAASLLEKEKGNVGVAVDKYYNICAHVFGEEEISMHCNVKTETCIVPLDSSSEMASDPSQKTTNLPSLFVHGTSADEKSVINVALPIQKYSPIEHACWKAGDPAPYLHLARTFDSVEREKGKLKTTALLCNMFRSLLALSPDDVLPAVYLCTNKIAADHENMELNVGGSLVISALEEACWINKSRIKAMYNSTGDLGDVAQECQQTQKLLAPPRPLSIHDLFHAFRKISEETGSGSAIRRKNLVVTLMRSCREMEMKFIVRSLVRNLRIGAMMKTILPALGQAVVLNSKSLKHVVESSESLKLQLQLISVAVVDAYNVIPNLDLLIPSLMSNGVNFSGSTLPMVPGTPIPPMLARITNGVDSVMKLFQHRAFTCEYKYDGQRAQIHKLFDGSIRIFSRQMKDSTSRFPDVINIIEELGNLTFLSFVLDAEVVAVDRKNGSKLMSFQELSSRERGSKGSSITMDSIKVEICIFVFDIMFSNGERLLALPLRERRKYLRELFPREKPGHLEFAKEITVEADEASLSNQSTLTKMNTFFEDACKSSCEGIMVKTLDIDAAYCASKRTDSWLKVKHDYVEGLGDSLDLVPIGAWHGNGRKAGWYSPFLMACYHPDAEEFQSVCRVMSGFSDTFYVQMKDFFSGEKLLSKKPPYYQTDESPDMWFSPEVVWEIKGSDFTISPVHHAAIGLVHPSRGISVRLPRFIRSVSSDRKPEDCNTSADIACMFNSQTRKMEVGKED